MTTNLTSESRIGLLCSDVCLDFHDVIGTSATKSGHIAVEKNLIAYTASGGIVISEIDDSSATVKNQRFLSANLTVTHPVGISPANAYLKLAQEMQKDPSNADYNQKDSFGFPKVASPMIFSGGRSNNIKEGELTGSKSQESDSGSPSKLKEKVRTVNCLSLAPNRTMLAVGEAGYQPRILLFSLAPDSGSGPFAVIYDHSFGINLIKFSPDSKLLCSVGLVNDGYVNIWKLSSTISLKASNKCSSIVHDIIWNGDFLVMLGLRFLKVWNVKESIDFDNTPFRPSVLKGRNVHLGPLISGAFFSGEILNEEEVLINSNHNQILILKMGDLSLLSLNIKVDKIDGFLVDQEHQSIWISTNGNIAKHEIKDLVASQDIIFKGNSVSDLTTILKNYGLGSPTKPIMYDNEVIQILDLNVNSIIYLTAKRSIKLFDKKSANVRTITEAIFPKVTSSCPGTDINEITLFSKCGSLKVIDIDTDNNISLRDLKEIPFGNVTFNSNFLTAVSRNSKLLAAGDQQGNIVIVEYGNKESANYLTKYSTKAHSSSVNQCLFFEVEQRQVLCTISRDRMIQLFCSLYDAPSSWDILQTIPLHTGNLLKAIFSNGMLFVSSTDRTISVHSVISENEQLKIEQEKIISIKSTPLNMKIYNDELIVSSSDRNLLIYDMKNNFELKRTLKLFSEATADSLTVEDFIVFGSYIIVSCSDRSLRIFSYFSGKSLHVAWGHSDPIIGLFLTPSLDGLISIGSEGCLFRWGLKEVASISQDSVKTESPILEHFRSFESPESTKVTRKILNNNLATVTPNLRPTSLKKRSPTLRSPTRDEQPASPSPLPKLSSATLRRLEAKKSASNSPKKSASLSPSKYNYSSVKDPVTKKSVPKQPNGISLKIPLSTSSIIVNNGKPLDSSAKLSTEEEVEVFPDGSPFPGTFIDTSRSYLDFIKAGIRRNQLSYEQKQSLQLSILDLLNEIETKDSQSSNYGSTNDIPKPNSYDQILEKYSNDLIDLIKSKLN